MKKPFVPNESYMHKAAKEQIVAWLREEYRFHEYGRIGSPFGVKATRPRFILEYPIGVNGEGLVSSENANYLEAWDETDVWRDVKWTDDSMSWGDEKAPTVQQLLQIGIVTKYVVDVMVLHKGLPTVALEIVHKHKTPPNKIAWLYDRDLDIVEYSATRIMNQIGMPRESIYMRRLSRYD